MSDAERTGAGDDVGPEPWPPLWALDEFRRWEAFRGMRFGRDLGDLEVSHHSSDVADAALERILTGRAQWHLFYLGRNGKVLHPLEDGTPDSAGRVVAPSLPAREREPSRSPRTEGAVSVHLDTYETALDAVVGVLAELGAEDARETAIHDFHVDGVLIDWPLLL